MPAAFRTLRRLALCATAPALLSACAIVPPAPPAGSATVTPTYSIAGGEWNMGGGILIAAGLEDRGGQAAVCAAWTRTTQSALSHFVNEDVIAAGSIFLDGRRIASNLLFAQRLPENAGLEGQRANCVLTGLPWSPGLEGRPLAIRLPRMQFGGGYELDSDPPVIFRQTLF